MSLESQYDDASDATFQHRVLSAAAKAALNVAGESPSGISPARYAKRHALAVSVLTMPESYAFKFALAVVAGGIVTTASTDGDIEFTVNAVFDDMAGVRGDETP